MAQSRYVSRPTSSKNRRSDYQDYEAGVQRAAQKHHKRILNKTTRERLGISNGGHEPMSTDSSLSNRQYNRRDAPRLRLESQRRYAANNGHGGHDARGAYDSGSTTRTPGKYVPKDHVTTRPKSVRMPAEYGRGTQPRPINKADMQRGRDEIERMRDAARRTFDGSTPSRRPDEPQQSVRTGKERADHKYIDKVKTKSGKIRYIYEIDTADGKKRDANSVHDANKKRIAENARKNLEATHRGADARNKATKEGNSPLGKVRGAAQQLLKNLRNTPLAKIFG